MAMYMMYGDVAFGSIDTERGVRVRGERAAGGHGLVLEVDVRTSARQESQIEVVWLWGHLQTGSRLVTHLAPHGPMGIATLKSERTVTQPLSSVLDIRQLKALDESRDSQPELTVRLFLGGAANGPEGPKTFSSEATVRVHQEEWLRLLRDSGYGATLLCEIVVPSEGADAELARAIEALSQAQAETLHAGRERETVARCREVLEAAGLDSRPPTTLHFAEGVNPRDLSFGERLDILHYAMWHLGHLGHHPGQGGCTRSEARLVLQATTSLLEYEQRARTGRG